MHIEPLERARDLGRMGEIAAVFARHGLGDLIRRAGLAPLFERARQRHEAQGRPGAIHAARWAVARCLRSLGRASEALAEQERLAASAEGKDDGFVAEEIAECLVLLGRAADARPHARRAAALLAADAGFAAEHPERIERMRELAGD